MIRNTSRLSLEVGAITSKISRRGLKAYNSPPRKQASFIEGGLQSAIGLAALAASVQLIDYLKVGEIYNHVQKYLDALERELVDAS